MSTHGSPVHVLPALRDMRDTASPLTKATLDKLVIKFNVWLACPLKRVRVMTCGAPVSTPQRGRKMDERLVITRELFQPTELNIVQEAYEKVVQDLKRRGVVMSPDDVARIVFLFASSLYVEPDRLMGLVLNSFTPVDVEAPGGALQARLPINDLHET
jgi:hypothetical protein